MNYTIEWINDDGENILQGKTYKNKDDVITELSNYISFIIGDGVTVYKKDGTLVS